MRIYRIVRKLLAVLLLAALLPGFAAAEEAALEEKSLELGNSSVRWPEITGMADEETQRELNARLREGLGVDGYLSRMSMLISEETLQIHTEWEGAVLGDVFSGVLSAEGALENSRRMHRWTWSNLDLRDGHEIGMDELFTNPEAARTVLEEYLDYEVAPELSAHLANSELVPLPEGFRIERTGITLLYPASRLSTLKDRAGDVKIGWNEIREVLNLEEDSILARAGITEMITLAPESADRIRAMTESGMLPDIPVQVGEPLKPLTDRYHLLIDPDVYEGGRMFSLEGGCFRGVFLLTDFLSEQWDSSIVQGIRMDRGCAWGLCIGQTRREEWQAVLGEPDASVEMDAERAEAGRMEPGICDYYRFGAYQLRLYADTEGTLVSIVLTE